MPARDQTTVGAYRDQIVERLFAGMLSARFSEMAQKPDAPFLGAGAGRGQFVRPLEVSTLSAGVKEDGIERGLDALFTEALRVEKFGFTATELDRQKRNIMRGLERAVAEKDNTPSSSLADEYVRNFTDKEPTPGIDYEMGLHARSRRIEERERRAQEDMLRREREREEKVRSRETRAGRRGVWDGETTESGVSLLVLMCVSAGKIIYFGGLGLECFTRTGWWGWRSPCEDSATGWQVWYWVHDSSFRGSVERLWGK
jgi:hypothetical protein